MKKSSTVRLLIWSPKNVAKVISRASPRASIQRFKSPPITISPPAFIPSSATAKPLLALFKAITFPANCWKSRKKRWDFYSKYHKITGPLKSSCNCFWIFTLILSHIMNVRHRNGQNRHWENKVGNHSKLSNSYTSLIKNLCYLLELLKLKFSRAKILFIRIFLGVRLVKFSIFFAE